MRDEALTNTGKSTAFLITQSSFHNYAKEARTFHFCSAMLLSIQPLPLVTVRCNAL